MSSRLAIVLALSCVVARAEAQAPAPSLTPSAVAEASVAASPPSAAVPSAPAALPSPPSSAAPPAPPAHAPAIAHASFDDGVRLESADGRFGFRIGAVLQYRAQLNQMNLTPPDRTGAGAPDPDHWHGSFNSFFVRPQLRLHAFGNKLKVFLQPEFAGTGAQLLDFELTYQPHEAFALKAGQFMTPYSRMWLTPIPVLQFVDFGFANDVFRWGRDTGVMAYGTPLHGKLEYYVGVFNGNGINQSTFQHVHGMGVARLVASPLGAVPYDQTVFLDRAQPFRFSVGLDGYWNRMTPYTGTTPSADRTNKALGADFVVTVDRFHFITEAYVRHVTVWGAVPNFTQWGFEAQAGYFIPRARLEIAARASYANLDRATRNDDMTTWEGALHYYIHGNHAKLQLRYQYAVAGSGFSPVVGNAMVGTAPASTGTSVASYMPGAQHRILLQAQVFF